MQALWMMVALWPKLPTDIRAGLAMAPDSQPADLAKALFTPQHLQKAVPALLATSGVLPHLHGAWAALLQLAGTGSKSGKRLASLWEQVQASPACTPSQASLAVTVVLLVQPASSQLGTVYHLCAAWVCWQSLPSSGDCVCLKHRQGGQIKPNTKLSSVWCGVVSASGNQSSCFIFDVI